MVCALYAFCAPAMHLPLAPDASGAAGGLSNFRVSRTPHLVIRFPIQGKVKETSQKVFLIVQVTRVACVHAVHARASSLLLVLGGWVPEKLPLATLPPVVGWLGGLQLVRKGRVVLWWLPLRPALDVNGLVLQVDALFGFLVKL